MASLLPGHELPSPKLKEWPPSDSTARPVGGASGPPGAPSDTWESVAKAYGMDVMALIDFNFKTNDPKVVNWYLRTVVGCNTPSPTDWNWTFRGAKPGIIYLPIKKIDMDPLAVGPGVSDRPHPPPDFTLKDSDQQKQLEKDAKKYMSKEQKAVWEIEKRLLYYTVGKPTGDAIRDNREVEYWSGVCHGIVLGDDGVPAHFVTSNFGVHLNRRDADKDIDDLYQHAYQMGLAAGFEYAGQMNDVQKGRLRRALRSHMDLRQYPAFGDRSAWATGRNFVNYYSEASATFQRYLLNFWIHGNLQTYLQANYP